MKNWTLRFRETDRADYELVRDGTKSVETRAATVRYRNVAAGDTLTFVCGKDSFQKRVVKVYVWPSIDAMVHEIPFSKVMPRVKSLEEMKKVYAGYNGYEEKIKENGLVGFALADA